MLFLVYVRLLGVLNVFLGCTTRVLSRVTTTLLLTVFVSRLVFICVFVLLDETVDVFPCSLGFVCCGAAKKSLLDVVCSQGVVELIELSNSGIRLFF